MASSDVGGGTVVIAYDGSPASRQAIVDSAKLVGSCRILVVTVWEEGLAYTAPILAPTDGLGVRPMVDPETARELDSAVHEHANRVSTEGATLAQSLGLEAEPLALPDEGSAARTILRLARERDALAIVVGSRGLGGIRARIEGSTSKDLLKHSPCPVLVVHEVEDKDDAAE
ncbi:MAG TPA: universal stress protein [Solirubrobacteraceae bacterium]|nr:universal stress protein [Solirubrobacteraceae bacterium]